MGSMFPRSTNQVIHDKTPSLGLVTAVARGDSGDIWFTDIDNNRVYEVNKAGDLIRGFEGLATETIIIPHPSAI